MSVTRGQKIFLVYAIRYTYKEGNLYGYLPSHKASPPIGWYQIILLGDRGTCVLTTCPWLHSTSGRLGFEPATC